MADLFATNLAWLNGQMRDNASTAFVYRRRSSSVEIECTIGGTRVSPLTVLAGVMADRDLSQPSPKHADHPLWFNAEDLVLDGDLTTPIEGDTMERSVSGVTTVYKLAAPLDGGRAWKYAGGHETGPEARICWNGRLMSVSANA